MDMQIEDLMEKAIKYALKLGARFVEVKGEDTVTGEIETVNKEVRTVSEAHNVGIGVRVFYGKGSGFSFSNILDEENVLKTVEAAVKIAKASAKRALIKPMLAYAKAVEGGRSISVNKHPREVALDEKKDMCVRQCEVAMGRDERIANVRSRFGEYHGTIYYANSEGARAFYEPILVGLGVSCVAKRGDVIVDARDGYGGSFGLSAFEEEGHTPEKMAENAADWAVEKLEAKPAPAGRFDALINSDLAGILAHESFGHLSEADFVAMGASPLTGRMGQKLGADIVTIIDEGVPKEGGYWIPFDDEGVPCSRVEILKDGILSSYLHSRETAHRLKMSPTGNARSQDYSFEPIVRMRNTYFKAGDWKLDEALKDLKRGIYAIDSAGGQTEFTGDFLFKAVRGYWVEEGELKYPLRDVALTGNILELLKNVEAICDDIEIRSGPFGGCGKWDQRAFVGDGGPHIRIRNVLFGGAK